MRKHAAAALLFVLASVVMTWPLARLMDRAVSDPGDPYINVWILDWDHHATFTKPLSLFHANAFHPARYSLAFSENLYGIALLLVPFRLLGMEPITAYNVAMLAGFAFSGFGAYLLTCRLTLSWPGAIAAGVFYAFVPFRFVHLSHLQHVWGGWLPLLLAALIAYVDRPGWRRAAIFGFVFLMNGLTNIHWFLFGSFSTLVAAALFYAAGVRRWKELVVSTTAALLLFAPFLYPYAAAADLYEMTRSWEETKLFSATLSDWGPGGGDGNPERRLFPGLLSIAVALGALAAIRRHTRPVVLGIVWVTLGVAGSLGLNFFFHEFLFDAVPGFKAVRAPARWAAIAYIGMAMLIAVTGATIERRWRWASLTIAPLLLATLWVAPIRWYLVDPEPPPVYRWIAEQPVRAIVELPINHAGSEYRYLLRATAHQKPLLNGVSGFTPPFTARLTEMSKSAPIPEIFVEELRSVGTDLIVVHADQLGEFGASTRAWLREEIARGRLRFVRRFHSGMQGDWVFAFGRGSTSPQLNAFLEGRWTRNQETFGFLQPPPDVARGPAAFSGWALSPHGVRKVDLLFQNGAVRVATRLRAHDRLSAEMPWYPQTPQPWFEVTLPARPEGVRPDTDVQVEILDGRGKRTLLPPLWFRWER
ncbi:MAG TPA: hypothetical protein VFT12_10005 [Thermoanaerobaculia bacterium]|nr:hypothetical protein [Thermoanaerobaculia bacterium]